MKTTVECRGHSFQVTRDNGKWSIFPSVFNPILEMKLRCLAAKKETLSDGKVIVKRKGMEYDGFAVTIGKDDVTIEPMPSCLSEVLKILDSAVAQIYKENSVMMGDGTQSVKGPLNDIHAQLAVKDIHGKMEKALGNITASCVARTRPIKSESRLLTTWQTEILEIMEANNVPEENIGKVLDLL